MAMTKIKFPVIFITGINNPNCTVYPSKFSSQPSYRNSQQVKCKLQIYKTHWFLREMISWVIAG